MINERGSITVLSFVTVMFILIILATLFYSTVEKSKSQVIEMEKLSNAYDGDMGEIYKERKSSERIYVTLYSDGGLVFTNSNRKIEGREVTKEYGDISSISNIPWESDRTNITKVEFADKVSPLTTANWFKNCENLTTIVNMNNLDTSKVTNMRDMFYVCKSLKNLDLSNLDTSKVTNMDGMLAGCEILTSLDVTNFDTSNVTSMRFMFSTCYRLASLDLTNFDTSKVSDMEGMFNGCSSLSSISMSNKFDTSNVSNMFIMFYHCGELTSIDLSNFNTSKVTNVGGFLGGCDKLTDINLKGFNLSATTTYHEFLPSLSSSAVIKTNQTMADWIRENYPGVSGNIQVI